MKLDGFYQQCHVDSGCERLLSWEWLTPFFTCFKEESVPTEVLEVLLMSDLQADIFLKMFGNVNLQIIFIK